MYECLIAERDVIDETKELLSVIACSEYTKKVVTKTGVIKGHKILIDHNQCAKLITNLAYLYHQKGMGFKLLSSIFENVSYTRLRTIFQKLGIEKRIGMSCTTDTLKLIRSENAKIKNPWINWPEKYPDKDRHSKRHLGGWYFNVSQNKFVWLRSSWEFGYASWLDSLGKDWDVEVRNYLLKDGRYYRPDFFIFSDHCLDRIVEIKSRWNNGSAERIDKFELFKREYDIKSEIIIDNDLFNMIGKSQPQVLKEWKVLRSMEHKDDK